MKNYTNPERRYTGSKQFFTRAQLRPCRTLVASQFSVSIVRAMTSLFLALVVCGCSTVQTSDLPPEELQDQIADRGLVKPGDHVSITTSQGMTYELEITQVTEQSVKGLEVAIEPQQTVDENADISVQTVRRNPVDIPVAEIRTIETRELTPMGKAASATGAVVAVGGVMYFIYILLPALLVSAIVGL